MKLNIKYDKCEYTKEELEKFRDSDGFIDLTKAKIKLNDYSKDKRGNQNRIKNWVKLKNAKILVKGEIKLDDKPNYGIYAELIAEEIAKKLNIPTAHYDLMKIKNADDTYTKGVISYKMDEDGELISLNELMNYEEDKSEFVDATDYYFTIDKIKQNLENKYSVDKINDIIIEYQKRLCFAICLLATDNHIENISFIKSKDDFYLSPNYDYESSLLLDNDILVVDKILSDYQSLANVANIAEPRIGIYRKRSEGGLESFWQDTLEALIESDEIYDYCVNVLKEPVMIDEVLNAVEMRIKAKLPEQVKLLAKYAYLARNTLFNKILDGLL